MYLDTSSKLKRDRVDELAPFWAIEPRGRVSRSVTGEESTELDPREESVSLSEDMGVARLEEEALKLKLVLDVLEVVDSCEAIRPSGTWWTIFGPWRASKTA